jgi:hypothetical protein
MTNFEKAVNIIIEAYQEDCKEYDCSISELFKCWGCDTEDLKEEFLSILNQNNFPENAFTDDCEILEDNNEVKTLRQLINAVKKG